jgi:hypothetical protein
MPLARISPSSSPVGLDVAGVDVREQRRRVGPEQDRPLRRRLAPLHVDDVARHAVGRLELEEVVGMGDRGRRGAAQSWSLPGA